MKMDKRFQGALHIAPWALPLEITGGSAMDPGFVTVHGPPPFGKSWIRPIQLQRITGVKQWSHHSCTQAPKCATVR